MNLEVKDLKKSFGKHQVLKGISFSLKENQIVGLLGPNGNGKTTLIKCINDLLTKDSGLVAADGEEDPVRLHEAISYLPERTYLDPEWSAKQAMSFFETFYPDFSKEKAKAMLEDFRLDPSMKIKSMSKGMQEKLQFALVLSRKARLYILDEPLSGVDPAARDRILDSILSAFEPGSSILISTHMIADIERILDRVLFLKDGRIILDESAETLRETRNASIDQVFREEFA